MRSDGALQLMPEDKKPGAFYGIGVGPGPSGLIPLAAYQTLQACDIVFVPRAKSSAGSTALKCVETLSIPKERLREVFYDMDSDRALIDDHYESLAKEVAACLQEGLAVAYLTIGDPFTYSTYSYTLAALLKLLPDLEYQTFPGVTSYAAVAAAHNWPLGQGKERVLILPCPDDMDELSKDIDTHDIVVLMKIGRRLAEVLALLRSKDIAEHCAFASRIGLPGEQLCADVTQLNGSAAGYLSTMLIRKTPAGFHEVAQVGGDTLRGKAPPSPAPKDAS